MEVTIKNRSRKVPFKYSFEQDLHGVTGVGQLESNYEGFECHALGHIWVLWLLRSHLGFFKKERKDHIKYVLWYMKYALAANGNIN